MNVLLGFLIRRGGDLIFWVGGILAFLLPLWTSLSPATQDALLRLLQGNWRDVTLGAIIPVAIGVINFMFSLRATIKPQIVTSDGKKIDMRKELSESAQHEVEKVADRVRQPRTIVEMIRGMFGR